MTIIMIDGFDDRLNLDNGVNEGDWFTGWGLYPNGVWDGDDLGEGGIRGILAGEGRYDGKNAMSLEHTDDFDGDLNQIVIDITAEDEFVFGCAFRSTMNENDLNWYVWTGSVWRRLVTVSVNEWGRVIVLRRISGGSSSTEVYLVSTNQQKAVSQYGWHYIHGIMEVGKGTGLDSMQIWLDGVKVIDADNITLSQSYGSPTRVEFPSAGNEMDDAYVIGGTLTSPGEVRILSVFPNGTGASNDFTPTGEATNWENVDELDQDFDNTYNQSIGTSGHRDSFTVQPITDQIAAADSIPAVVIRCMASASASEQIKAFLLINGTRYYSNNYSPPSGRYEYLQFIWETNPDTAAPWTLTDLENLEIGYEVV